MLRTALAVATVLLACAPLGAGCGGRSIRPDAPVAPRLSSERLGDIRSALTFEGDWMGGTPAVEDLEEVLDLARRRGVELLIDLRADSSRLGFAFDGVAAEAGMTLVVVDRTLPSGSIQELSFEISNAAIDHIRGLLNETDRAPALLLDDDGALAASVYAIYLTVDRGVDEDETLRTARRSGLTEDDVAFVRLQVERIGG